MTETPVLPPWMRRQGEFDPDPSTVRMREVGGIARMSTRFDSQSWLVTRLADVREVLADCTRFSNVLPPDRVRRLLDEQMSDEDVAHAAAGNLLFLDPPEHTRLRRMLTPAFTMRQIRRLEPWIQQIVENHLDAMEHAGPPVDLVPAFALPIPSLVICQLLGVPCEDREDFHAVQTGCWTCPCRRASGRPCLGKPAPTWPISSPANRRTPARRCWAHWCANTGTTSAPTNWSASATSC